MTDEANQHVYLKLFDRVVKHPFLIAVLFFYGMWLTYAMYIAPNNKSASFQDEFVNASAQLAVMEERLKLLNAKEAFELVHIAQQFVDLRDPDEAWIKYRDYEDGEWDLLAVNNSYTREFGISVDFDGLGKTGFEIYSEQRADLTDEELVLLKQYQINDTKASRVRDGCLLFEEWVLPLSTPPVKRKYRKCRMTSGNMLLVYGERYREDEG